MWITRFASRGPAGLACVGRWPELPQSGQSVPAIPATDPPQGTAELISHIWGIFGKVHVRKGRKYHRGRGERNKMSETTEGIS